MFCNFSLKLNKQIADKLIFSALATETEEHFK